METGEQKGGGAGELYEDLEIRDLGLTSEWLGRCGTLGVAASSCLEKRLQASK